MTDADIDEIIKVFAEKEGEIRRFTNNVREFFQDITTTTNGNLALIHSIKHRLKDKEHLKNKILRKPEKYSGINSENFMEMITDLGGVRILHLYHDQFELIHQKIIKQVEEKNWAFYEDPKAYTWDIELQQYFTSLKLDVEINERYYTSVHYVVKPHESSPYTCEIQVRTLFEEIWGELDHSINYPTPSTSTAQKEQLRVLAKLVGTGTTLANSIFRSQQ